MSDYRDCPRCERLRDENQKTVQAAEEAKAQLATMKRWNRTSAFGIACIVGVCGAGAWLIGNVIRGNMMRPEQCVESVEIVASDQYRRSCPAGATLLVTPMQDADRVLVRCECGSVAPETAGSAKGQ